MTIPNKLRECITDVDSCEVTTLAALCEGHDVESANGDLEDVSDNAVVVVEPGWRADDGYAEIEIPDADSAHEAAEQYVEGGDWGDGSQTVWVHVRVWRVGYALDADGHLVTLLIDSDRHTVTVEARPPQCEADEHDWCAPHEVVGGIEENPGVWGHGGGVIITEVCRHCGAYRETDTYAQDPETGQQGLRAVEYREPDEASREWIASLAEEA